MFSGGGGMGGNASGFGNVLSTASSVASIVKLFSANGNAFSNGRVQMFAKGGLLDSPTMFNTGSGLAIGGEAGTEAILPLKRNANGNLGVEVAGGSSRPIIVNISTPNPERFKQSKNQISSMLRRAVNYNAGRM
jgi:phage-related minor tail protein